MAHPIETPMGRLTHSGHQARLACGCLSLIVIALVVLTGFRAVQAGHVGIVKTGGTVSTVADPGFNHIWFPFQQIDDVDLRTQKQQFSEIDAATSEQQTIRVTGTITYHIEKANASSLYQSLNLDDIVSTLLDPALQDYVKEATVQYPAADILNHRSDIRQHALDALNTRLKQNYPGIVVTDIFISNMAFSEDYQSAIEEKQVAQQQVQTAQQHQDRAKIDADTAVIQAQGEAKANQVRASTLTAALIQYIATQKWDGHLPQVTGGATPFIDLRTP